MEGGGVEEVGIPAAVKRSKGLRCLSRSNNVNVKC